MTTIPRLKREGSERSAPSRAVQNAPGIDGSSGMDNLPSKAGEPLPDPLARPERACPASRLKQGRSREKWQNWQTPYASAWSIEPRTNPGETRELRARRKASNKERTERNCPDEGKEKTR